MTPEISIIMPAFNAQATICRSIQSIIDQRFKNFELIIINDCSTDMTMQEITSFLGDQRIKLINNEKSLGAACSRNKGLTVANGDYISFLDADDTWDKNFLTEMYNFLTVNNYSFVYCNYKKFFEDESGKKPILINAPSRINTKILRINNFVPCCSVLIEVKYKGKYLFPEIYSRHDYAYWFKILEKHQSAYNVGKTLLNVYSQKNSLSKNVLANVRLNLKILKDFSGLNILFVPIYFFIFLVFNFLKKSWVRMFNLLVKFI